MHVSLRHLVIVFSMMFAGLYPWVINSGCGCCAVVQRDEPTQAEVDALHARVLAELTLLFEQRKHLVPALAHKMLETLL